MKKFLIVFISILLLLSSFVCGFFLRKHIYDNNINSLLNENIKLENDNKNLKKTIGRYETFIPDNWEKLTDEVYLDKKSIKKHKYTISAWFKIFYSKEEYNGGYRLIKYEADCESPALCCNHVIQFDKNGNLLADYPDFSDICTSGKSGWYRGETAYEALCKLWKNGK